MEFKWLPELAIGVDSIDNQHKSLINRVNILMDAVKRSDIKAVQESRTFFIDYVFTHFKSEEAFMSIIGYPDLENHKVEHVEFLKNIAKFRNADVTSDVMNEMLKWSTDWLVNHICGTDKKIGVYYRKYREQGQQQEQTAGATGK